MSEDDIKVLFAILDQSDCILQMNSQILDLLMPQQIQISIAEEDDNGVMH